jgi:hypothetical protein
VRSALCRLEGAAPDPNPIRRDRRRHQDRPDEHQHAIDPVRATRRSIRLAPGGAHARYRQRDVDAVGFLVCCVNLLISIKPRF